MSEAIQTQIEDPRKWHLLLEVRLGELCGVGYSLYDGEGMVMERIKLRDESLQALEDGVYEHPWLLGDFKRVTILVDTPRMTGIPQMVEAGSRMWKETFRRMFPDTGRGEILSSPIEEMKLNLAYEIECDKAGFLRRTFHNATMRHVMAPLGIYFQRKHPSGGEGKMLVNFDGDRMDMVVLGRGGAPLVLKSFTVREPMDAVYYIMGIREALRLPDREEIMIGGDGGMRAAVTPHLREYVRYVMPALFPAVMYRIGRDALRAPFALILSPLT